MKQAIEKDKRKEAAIIAGGLTALGLFLFLMHKAKAGSTLYVCPYCGAEFPTEGDLLHHIEQEHREEPPTPTNLLGTVVDSSTGQLLSGVKISLDSMTTYTDVSGAYAFYGLTANTPYTISVEKEYYNPFSQSVTVQLGQNLLHMSMEPVYIQSVTIGIRTRASPDNIPTPNHAYLSRPCMQTPGYVAMLLGPDYIDNTSYYTDYTVNLTENPITKGRWKESEIPGYRFGVWLWASGWISGATRCTQIWVEVHYSDGTSKILRPYSGSNWEKVADIEPDEDASYISYTTSGGMIPELRWILYLLGSMKEI